MTKEQRTYITLGLLVVIEVLLGSSVCVTAAGAEGRGGRGEACRCGSAGALGRWISGRCDTYGAARGGRAGWEWVWPVSGMVGWVCWVAGVACLVWSAADCAIGAERRRA